MRGNHKICEMCSVDCV